MKTGEFDAKMDERFGADSLIALATCEDGVPSVRAVNAYYENGAFYFITYALSGKMRQIAAQPKVGVCGEWFTGHGIAESIGWICAPENADLADKLRVVFDEWYSNGHVDESDENTIIVRVTLTDGVLLSHGTRHELTADE